MRLTDYIVRILAERSWGSDDSGIANGSLFSQLLILLFNILHREMGMERSTTISERKNDGRGYTHSLAARQPHTQR